VFILGQLSDTRKAIPVSDTATPFRFTYLGTEPGLSTLTPEATYTPVPTAIELALTSTELAFATNTVLSPIGQFSQTPTASSTIESGASKFDDTYTQILYTGDWDSQTNVSDTYQNTLHISFTVGNSASFTFVGEKVILSFQSGPSLGRISITLDGFPFEVDQSGSNTQLVDWQSGVLVRGTHTIIIAHLSGGSVNIDSITIPNVSTPTPTETATTTPTP
jgi:hypothetical protein